MHDVRRARTTDHTTLVECVQRWWGDSRTPEQARELSLLLPRLFLQHFAGTSLVLEDETGVRAFLVGFHSADRPHEAYIHFVGVDPELRKQGVARRLYTAFFERAAAAGRTEVRAITSPQNTGSIAFHQAMGFEPEPGDREADGVPVHGDYDGPGQDRVAFRKKLGAPEVRTLEPFTTRAAVPEDFDTVVSVVDDWWGRPASRDLTRVFVNHFHDTSLIAERDGELAGFVIGFLSPSRPDEAYIHFTGVNPAWRRTGLGRFLYERFFAMARANGRTVVKAITSPQNARSIAFHRALGFTPSDPITDYDGPSLDRVTFRREL
ncbi:MULTISPECIES: GNAT family N-acetyltransferase [Streptomyces]|uniref:GNAT family N-acetyltransferase n=1 Tax=Streptomyces TaxID=1883 RepID=UPI0004C4BD25|nr:MULTISPECIES: GNAT family N-acetyltransferase [Streptomyces]KOT54138.1 GCN5 family acetyltransferase [Streptomyces rimosus subsp. rimosus]